MSRDKDGRLLVIGDERERDEHASAILARLLEISGGRVARSIVAVCLG